MPCTSNTPVLLHPSSHLVHMKSISPHTNVCPSHQIPQESTDTPHDITPLILELIPRIDLDQLNHLIPQVQDPLPQVKLLLTDTTTELRVHLFTKKYQTRISKKVLQFFYNFLLYQKIFSDLIFKHFKKKLKCFLTKNQCYISSGKPVFENKMSFVDQSLSLFIPRVFPNITQERISSIFYNLGLGDVKRVDRVLKQDGDGNEYYSVYVHFEYWYETNAVANFQERVTNPGKEARIVYDDPWWWIVLENKGQKRVPGQRKPTLVLEEPTKKSVSFAEVPMDPTVQENWDLVDAAYAEYYEIQLEQERAKVEHLECALWNMQQQLIREHQANEYLSTENQALQEELAHTFKPLSEDIEEGLKSLVI